MFETKRLILREWRDSDIPAFSAMNQDPKVMEFFPATLSLDETKALVERIRQHFKTHSFGLFAVEIKATGEFIGFVGLMIPTFEAHFTPCVEIGWRIASAHWRQGYATEAAKMVLHLALEKYGLKEVVSFTAAVNLPSIAVMQKIGLQHTPKDDFDHPRLDKTHPLSRHVLYRLAAKELQDRETSTNSNVNLKYIAITAWAKEILTGQGYSLQGDCVEVAATPWSSVHRILSDKGSVYLKQTPPALFLESKITPILHAQFPENTPHIIAANKDLHCFLMKDAGQPLREFFKAGFQSELLGCAIQKYTAIQTAFAAQINQFLDLGVPDWRLNKLPDLYGQLLTEKDLLIADGLTQSELNQLHDLLPTLTRLCGQLASYKIPETLDHCDFHDNNILIEAQTQKLTIIDWGEVVITHPFFSLVHCLHDAAYRYILQKTDHAVLEKACFKNWLPFKSKSNLLKAWGIAQRIWPIYSALGEYRLMTSCPPEVFKLLNRKGCLVRGLKAFIEEER